MSVKYIKSLRIDFNGSLILSQLQDEIVNNDIIPSLVCINRCSDEVEIVFDGCLTVKEQTMLDTLILYHKPMKEDPIDQPHDDLQPPSYDDSQQNDLQPPSYESIMNDSIF